MMLSELGRETKIWIVGFLTLGIFLLEIIAGYLTSSIALIADSFHMLSDLLALLIALYAIRLAKQRTRKPEFTFGYQRAEILGAFANSVFLLALCFTIVIEAIQRFFSPVAIENPKMVLIVGCVGLGTNLLGMFLFGGHVHHDHGDGGHDHELGHGHAHGPSKKKAAKTSSIHKRVPTAAHDHDDVASTSSAESVPLEILDNSQAVPMHYSAHARANIMAEAERMRQSTSNSLASKRSLHKHGESHKHGSDHGHGHSYEVGHAHTHDSLGESSVDIHDDCHEHNDNDGHGHGHHGGHGHDHGNMNMHGLFLHAMGDALGSLGVIISSLIIMFADGDWRYYMDPLISLLISGLIISSAMPLVRSASFILLQGVPSTVSMDKLRREILNLPGVLDVHEFHVWGLSDSKNVASVHIRCHDPSTNPDLGYMQIAAAVKRLLHGYGVHSTTVQPEFVRPRPVSSQDEEDIALLAGSDGEEDGCLLKCEGGGCNEQVCCPEDEPLMGGVFGTGTTMTSADGATSWLVSNRGTTGQDAVVEAPAPSLQSPVEASWFKKVAPFKLGKKDSKDSFISGKNAPPAHGHGNDDYGHTGHGHDTQGHDEHDVQRLSSEGNAREHQACGHSHEHFGKEGHGHH
ncbi:cation efflux family-domain-containing protein [Chytriomyces sp. MP71]|nr:cation efflux family-domain-containing protein [Chytriomyces sp. MP71]